MYAIQAPLAWGGLRGPLLESRARFRGRATAGPRVCRAALPVARRVSPGRPSCPRAWCPRASPLHFPRRRQSQTRGDGAPVEVFEQAIQVGVLLGLVIGEVGVLPAVDGDEHRLVGQQADVVLGLNEVVP